MGRLSHSESSPRSSIDSTANEGLPLYASLEVSTPDTLTAPSERATPDEVREFLVALLIKNRGLNQDHARRVASKWTLGTGRELTSYPPLLYAEIFGLEDAWMVYKEAKLFMKTEEKKKETLSSKLIGFAMVSIIETAFILAAVLIDVHHVGLKTTAIMISLVLGLIWIVCATQLLPGVPGDLESSIEAELTKGLLPQNKD
ncbi:hypothetical protein E4T44_04872 [Aureobasidium sp. EXF-8845]|nr:hypothetical protein E4T44_04872 [Aureobasidium sp. EXF-8845]KAI4846981.1 hypothetical protein E4T45_06993 [Aureobasidium sp. EXF-8846]